MHKKLLLFPAMVFSGIVCTQPLKIEISAGNHNRFLTPIQIHLTKPLNTSKMPYWAYAPVIDGAFTIDPGKWYHSQFRYLVHQGLPDKLFIEKIEKEYSDPPTVRVIAK